jgi:formylglycine-generating enzyme required for sulfatase activity
MMRIFISYSRTDEYFARRLAGSLREMGADVWIDVEDIPAGMKWSTAIQEGLDTTHALIVVITPSAMESDNVADEWQYMLDHDRLVIPVLLEEAKVNFQLNRIQYVDFLNQDYEEALSQLHQQLQRNGIALTTPTARTIKTSASEVAAAQSTRQPSTTPPPVPAKKKREPDPSFPRMALIGAVLMIFMLLIAGGSVLFPGMAGDDGGNVELVSTGDILLTDSAQRVTDNALTAEARDASQMSLATTVFMPTATPVSPDVAVTRNDDWKPLIRSINGVEMALVPAGSFQMGASDAQYQANLAHCETKSGIDCARLLNDEIPAQMQSIEQPFWIDVYEFREQTGDPVFNLDWNDAAQRCDTRGARLPTEIEWEYAASGPDNLRFPWGNTWNYDRPRANICGEECQSQWAEDEYNDGYSGYAFPGAFSAGASWVGAEDMSGNLWEWTATMLPDDRLKNGESAVLRGGAWTWILSEATTSSRSRYVGTPETNYYGFRCAQDYHDGDLERYTQ